MRRQFAAESVTALEKAGLVERVPDPADARAPLVGLTDEGRATLERIRPLRVEWANARPALPTPPSWPQRPTSYGGSGRRSSPDTRRSSDHRTGTPVTAAAAGAAGQLLHLLVGQVVHLLALVPVQPHPPDEQDDEDRYVRDLRDEPQEVAGEMLVVQRIREPGRKLSGDRGRLIEDRVVQAQEQAGDRIQDERDEGQEEFDRHEEAGPEHRVRRDREDQEQAAEGCEDGDAPLRPGRVAQDRGDRREEHEEHDAREDRREDRVAEQLRTGQDRMNRSVRRRPSPLSATRASATGRPMLIRPGTTKSRSAIRVVKAQRRFTLSAPRKPNDTTA